jgi:hypothetical protein
MPDCNDRYVVVLALGAEPALGLVVAATAAAAQSASRIGATRFNI